MNQDLHEAVDSLLPAMRQELESLVRIPSVSAPGYDEGEVRRSAEATAELLVAAGLSNVGLLELPEAHPAVFGELAGPPGAPTVLLYAHHDVQPPGPTEEWASDPFEPEERDGRLYGRGSSDDKAGIVLHTGVVRAFDGAPPVTIKVFVEGEEEIGSSHLEEFVATYGGQLAADAIVIADSGNWRVGKPALTTSLRGIISVYLDVKVLDAAVHSGMFGGAVPDALTILSRILASLHTADGNVAIPGLVHGDADPLDLTEQDVREQSGAVEGLELIGDGTLTSRMWMKPAASVLAIDAPPVSEAINQLVPSARAKVSVRLAPGDNEKSAMEALVAHLEAQPAWGAEVTVTRHEYGAPFQLGGDDPRVEAFRSAFAEAWQTDPIDIGVGGSIPFVAAFADAYPEAAILLTGVADPMSHAHGPNESLDLEELRKGTIAEAIALRLLADQ